MHPLTLILFSSALVSALPRLVTVTVVQTITETDVVPTVPTTPAGVYQAAVAKPTTLLTYSSTSSPAAPPPPPPPAQATSISVSSLSPAPPPPPPPPAVPSPPTNDQTSQPTTVSTESTDTTLARMTDAQVEAIVHTCWGGKLPWPLPDTVNPVIDVVSPQLSVFARPDTTPHTLTVHNYCGYDIFYDHLGAAGPLGNGTLGPGQSFDSPLSGNVFKASKKATMENDVLVEYNVAADGKLWYDISLITCLGSTDDKPNSDTSECAGHEAGLQLGNKEWVAFQCAPGKWCDDQAYLYQENNCKALSPVTQCDPSLGLTMEFCASMKK